MRSKQQAGAVDAGEKADAEKASAAGPESK
jgi:hypothetical protein